jgi:hypothetical protein
MYQYSYANTRIIPIKRMQTRIRVLYRKRKYAYYTANANTRTIPQTQIRVLYHKRKYAYYTANANTRIIPIIRMQTRIIRNLIRIRNMLAATLIIRVFVNAAF